MKTKLLVAMLLVGGSLFAKTHVSIGIAVGTPPPPPVVVYTPPEPGPGYVWVPGYWYPGGARYDWHAGFWARPPYVGAYWVAPRYYEHRYYPGYWERWKHHDRGEHRGWYKHHGDDDEQ